MSSCFIKLSDEKNTNAHTKCLPFWLSSPSRKAAPWGKGLCLAHSCVPRGPLNQQRWLSTMDTMGQGLKRQQEYPASFSAAERPRNQTQGLSPEEGQRFGQEASRDRRAGVQSDPSNTLQLPGGWRGLLASFLAVSNVLTLMLRSLFLHL